MASKRRVRAVVLRPAILDVDDVALLLAARAAILLAVLGALTTLLLWAFADVDVRIGWGESFLQVVLVLLVVRWRSRAVAALLLLAMLGSTVGALLLHLPLPRVVMASLGVLVALWLLWTAVGANVGKQGARRHRLERPGGALPALIAIGAGALWVGVDLVTAQLDATEVAAGECAGAPCQPLDAGPRPSDAERRAAEQRLDVEGPALPDCYTGEPGQLFVYTGDHGKDVVVERITEVPKSLRKGARCAR